jgi:uncharacterized damage-inducible protein DinB
VTVRDLQTLYEYSYWANGKLFAVIRTLTPEEFTQPVAGSYESLRNTLVHILSAEWGWLSRCGGLQRGSALKAADFPTFESVVATWTRVEAAMREFLSRLGDDDIDRMIEFESPAGGRRVMPLGELLHHGATHGVHHRGQIALLLRMLGKTPGNVDLLLYFAEKRGTPI